MNTLYALLHKHHHVFYYFILTTSANRCNRLNTSVRDSRFSHAVWARRAENKKQLKLECIFFSFLHCSLYFDNFISYLMPLVGVLVPWFGIGSPIPCHFGALQCQSKRVKYSTTNTQSDTGVQWDQLYWENKKSERFITRSPLPLTTMYFYLQQDASSGMPWSYLASSWRLFSCFFQTRKGMKFTLNTFVPSIRDTNYVVLQGRFSESRTDHVYMYLCSETNRIYPSVCLVLDETKRGLLAVEFARLRFHVLWFGENAQ